MKTKLDSFGRVSIPKVLRDRLGLRPGEELSITERDDAIVLEPVEASAALKLRDGVLVFGGEAKQDLTDAIRHQREARQRHLSGMDS